MIGSSQLIGWDMAIVFSIGTDDEEIVEGTEEREKVLVWVSSSRWIGLQDGGEVIEYIGAEMGDSCSKRELESNEPG